ncbi:MAG: hypothetical protein D6767_05075 [Candidatus Hydrogenedentota bacterium]|nr:MAG: hypothetical protein D6767_05075 [Candidatus Hydrogenedentota bacterium]
MSLKKAASFMFCLLFLPVYGFQLEDIKKYFPTIEVTPNKQGGSQKKQGITVQGESATDQTEKRKSVKEIRDLEEEQWDERWEAESPQQDDRLFQVKPNLLKGGSKINASFYGAEVSEVIKLFARKAKLSVVISPLVTGKVKSQFYNVPVKEALATLLEAHSLYYIPRKSVLEIVTENEYRYYTKIHLVKTKVYKIRWGNITRMVRAARPYLTRGIGVISVNRHAGKIAITDLPPRLALVEKVLKKLDAKNKQILLNIRVIEIQYEDETNIGTSYKVFERDLTGPNILTTSYASRRAPISEKSGGLRISAVFENIPFPSEDSPKRIDIILSAIGVSGEATYLTSPRVTVENNGTARILVGSEIPYPSAVQTQSGQFLSTFQFVQAGTILKITPRITNEKKGELYLNIYAENSSASIVDFSGEAALKAPQKDVNQVRLKANCLNGQTLVLSGFVRYTSIDDTAGIPLLMDIPYLKYLFSNTVTRLQKREVVVLITPRILDRRGTPIKRLYRKISGDIP